MDITEAIAEARENLQANFHIDGCVVEALLTEIDRQSAEICEKRTLLDKFRERDAEITAKLGRANARLGFLHDCSRGTTDPEGYEWGIYRVKWKDGKAVDVLQTLSDFSDLDAEMEREIQASMCPR